MCGRTGLAPPVTSPRPGAPRPLADSEKLPVQKHRNADTSKSPEKEDMPVTEKKSKKPKKKEKKHKERDRERRKEKERKVRLACKSRPPPPSPRCRWVTTGDRAGTPEFSSNDLSQPVII